MTSKINIVNIPTNLVTFIKNINCKELLTLSDTIYTKNVKSILHFIGGIIMDGFKKMDEFKLFRKLSTEF